MSKIHTYKDLEIWRKAIVLITHVYDLTKDFPKEEVYGLTSQMRRAACSVSLNIAEGWGRQSTQNFIQYLKISRGSLFELEICVMISNNLHYIQTKTDKDLLDKIEEIAKMINGLIKKLSKKEELSSN